MTDTDWDERYSASGRIWSGQPNLALVTEVAGLPTGRALDVGCGEGADAIWLAGQGWEVTALDVSRVALARARQAGTAAGVTVTWLLAGLLEAGDVPPFDLVSAQYPALRRTPGRDAERALLAAVAPGGTLLLVHHAEFHTAPRHDSRFDPADYVAPSDVAALLDGGWTVEVSERRARHLATGAGAGHSHDEVLRARRTTG